MRDSRVFVVLATAAVFSGGVAASAAEHHIPCNALPRAVQASSKALTQGAEVRGCVKDVSKGATTYEMELQVGGKSKDITFDDKGTVLEVEEQIDASALPASVAAALRTATSGGKVGKIESLARGGTIVSYETVITRGGKRREVAFRPDGSAMKAD